MGRAAEAERVFGDGESREVLFGEFDEFGVFDTTGSDEDHAVGCVVGLDVVGEVIALNGENVGFWAQNGAAKGLSFGLW